MGINIKDPSNNDILLDASAANTFTISSSGTERLRINSSGFVGVGTSNPSGEFHVNTISGNTDLVIDNSANTNDRPVISFRKNNSSRFNISVDNTSAVFYEPQTATGQHVFYTNSLERMRIDSSGNVGIGTSNPTAFVNSGLAAIGSINQTQAYLGASTSGINIGGYTGQVFVQASGVNFILGTSGANDVIFRTSATERMRIDSVGDISIGGSAGGLGRRLYITDADNQENSTIYSTNASYASEILQVIAARANTTAYNLAAFYSSAGTDYEFRFRGDGTAQADGTWSGGGADYAEYFEWTDENPENEDRRGISVALEGTKIRPAQEGDEIIGVISGNPSVVGDAAWNKWSGKYLRDEFGSYVFEDYEVLQWIDEEGKDRAVDAEGADASEAPEDATVVIQQRRKLNPDYDPDQEYVPRENRPEWAAVGLVGKLRLRKGQPVGDRWIKMQDISDSVEEWLVR